jgi:hypothetical protein
MTALADTVMLVWPLVVIGLFALMPPSRAVATAFVAGWLFLPFKSYPLKGLPDLTKTALTCYSVAAATLLLDPLRIVAFRPRWFDLALVGLCVSPGIASIDNGLGLYDALSACVTALVTWGLPYLVGRLYLTDRESLRFFSLAIVVGSLVYMPLCWFEMRMSPQLHSMVYGAGDYRWGGLRLGGWRPSVFFESGLQLGLWMSVAALTATWFWWSRLWQKLAGIRSIYWLGLLLVTTLLCRSSGALVLLFAAAAALVWTMAFKNRLALVLLVAVCPAYMLVRSNGSVSWQGLVDVIRQIDAERAESLEFRFLNEDMLVAKALQRPLFGWGGWGRSRVFDEWGKDISVTDGLWMIELGTHGILGLASLYAMLLLPLAFLVWNFPARRLLSTDLAPALVLAIAVVLFAIDCLLNAMVTPIYALAAGGVLEAVRRQALAEREVLRLRNIRQRRRRQLNQEALNERPMDSELEPALSDSANLPSRQVIESEVIA